MCGGKQFWNSESSFRCSGSSASCAVAEKVTTLEKEVHIDTKAKVRWWSSHLTVWVIIIGAAMPGSEFFMYALKITVFVVAPISVFLLSEKNIQIGATSARSKPAFGVLLAGQAVAVVVLLFWRGHELTSFVGTLSLIVILFYKCAVRDERQFRKSQKESTHFYKQELTQRQFLKKG